MVLYAHEVYLLSPDIDQFIIMSSLSIKKYLIYYLPKEIGNTRIKKLLLSYYLQEDGMDRILRRLSCKKNFPSLNTIGVQTANNYSLLPFLEIYFLKSRRLNKIYIDYYDCFKNKDIIEKYDYQVGHSMKRGIYIFRL